MEDEVLEMDEFVGKPERKASVGKMPAGEKTVAQRVSLLLNNVSDKMIILTIGL
jgi:hypothetical protein